MIDNNHNHSRARDHKDPYGLMYTHKTIKPFGEGANTLFQNSGNPKHIL